MVEDITAEFQFLIVKVAHSYVLIDKKIPFTKEGKEPFFSMQLGHQGLPFIEKALALYLNSSYQSLSSLTQIHLIYPLLNQSQIDLYNIKHRKELCYQELLDFYFMKTIMRHLYFVMPPLNPKRLNENPTLKPLIAGLQPDRVYAMIGMIQVKVVDKIERVHNLIVVNNPYIKDDPRSSGEMWGKVYLNNVKKNKKVIDLIIKGYG